MTERLLHLLTNLVKETHEQDDKNTCTRPKNTLWQTDSICPFFQVSVRQEKAPFQVVFRDSSLSFSGSVPVFPIVHQVYSK